MSIAWYNYPDINNYGAPDPYGGFPKPDINFAVPSGVPITTIASGTVSGIDAPDGTVPAWGHVVTIKLDLPYNSVATHIAYLHLSSVTVTIGQHVNVGDIIGYSGGTNPGNGLQQAYPALALYNGDYYGYGASWSQYLGSQLLNPTQLVQEIQTNAPLTQQQLPYQTTSFITDWLFNPIRIVKLLAGTALVIIVFMISIKPDIEQAVTKAIETVGIAA